MTIQEADLQPIQDGENIKEVVLNRPTLNLRNEVNSFNFHNTTTTSSNKTLEVGEQCIVTQAGLTLTLPASPAVNAQVSISVGLFTDTVVERNGEKIMGLDEDITMDIEYGAVTFVYAGSTEGWRIVR